MANQSGNTTETPSIRRRLASMLYESLLLLGVLAATFIVPLLGAFFIWGENTIPPGWALWLHIFLVVGAYFMWCWLHGGQTLAMQTWRIQVLSGSGEALTLRQAAIRYLLTWPSLSLGGIGILWALVDKDRQFLHDRLVGTRVGFKR